MPTEKRLVDGLRKISVTIEAGSAPDRMDFDVGLSKTEFIYGIGTDGLSALEAKLEGRGVGDTVSFSLNRAQIPAAAGHLCRHLPQLPDGNGPVYLRIRIEDVQEAENREIVKALAEMGSCGEGCCGGH